MNRLHLKKIFSGIFLVSVLTVTGTLSSLICPAETVRASDTLSNPKITDDSSLYAGKKVTWDCVWLGSYPQSEVTAENGQIYEKLKAADDSQWDENGDITIGNYKYRRLCRRQTSHTSWLRTTGQPPSIPRLTTFFHGKMTAPGTIFDMSH